MSSWKNWEEPPHYKPPYTPLFNFSEKEEEPSITFWGLVEYFMEGFCVMAFLAIVLILSMYIYQFIVGK